MNICTTLAQSNELAKILQLESADMTWSTMTLNEESKSQTLYVPYCKIIENECPEFIERSPCWSLTALMHIISKYSDYTIDVTNGKIVAFVSPFNSYNVIRCENTQFVDLCVDIIRKLNSNKLL